MSDIVATTLARARAWAASDPDPATAGELSSLIARADHAELAERMTDLEFGTAGLRGLVGAGSGRMNRAVIRRVSAGLARYLAECVPDARALGIVVGWDARQTSDSFAREAIGVFVGAGFNVRYFAAPVPTPCVAYAAKQLGTAAAVVVTASHNPRDYNGYKVYGANAAQIVAPTDRDIAARIAAAAAANEVFVAPEAAWTGRAELVPAELFERYWAELHAHRPPLGRPRAGASLAVVYTPIHGVGGAFAREALRRAGHVSLFEVPEQSAPDGGFPTAPFPNPEEAGVLDLAKRHATEQRADLILANDPDADRLAVAVPTVSGRWVQLTGDQVGCLLADYLLSSARALGYAQQPLVVSSIVSSPMLARIAEFYGARAETVLTGFKWIFDAALALERSAGVRFLFGYEEALGYAIPPVRDKDGISAAVLFADLAWAARQRGRSVLEELDALYVRFGPCATKSHSIVRPGQSGLEQIARGIATLRASPPRELAGRPVTRVIDHSESEPTSRPRWLPPTDLIELQLDGGGRVLVRPSGTEPKLKIYVHLLGSPVTETDEATNVRAVVRTLEASAAECAVALAKAAGFG
jgi:phosphomannomutase